jgi:hypothetical protein
MFRKMHVVALAVGTLLVALPGLAEAQGGQGMRGQGMGGQGGGQALQNMLLSPAQVAINNKADLVLTEEQETRLNALNRAFEEANKAHLDQVRGAMQAMQGGGGGGGGGMGALQAVQPAMQALQAARTEQITMIETFLSDGQKEKFRPLVQPRRPGGGR